MVQITRQEITHPISSQQQCARAASLRHGDTSFLLTQAVHQNAVTLSAGCYSTAQRNPDRYGAAAFYIPDFTSCSKEQVAVLTRRGTLGTAVTCLRPRCCNGSLWSATPRIGRHQRNPPVAMAVPMI